MSNPGSLSPQFSRHCVGGSRRAEQLRRCVGEAAERAGGLRRNSTLHNPGEGTHASTCAGVSAGSPESSVCRLPCFDWTMAELEFAEMIGLREAQHDVGCWRCRFPVGKDFPPLAPLAAPVCASGQAPIRDTLYAWAWAPLVQLGRWCVLQCALRIRSSASSSTKSTTQPPPLTRSRAHA